MGVTDWGEINQPLGAPALGGAGGWADSVAQALNNSDETVDARLATLEAAMEALIGQNTDDIAAMGVWQDYTPVVSGALTLGNGTVLGRYSQVNKTCDLQIALTLGTTSVMGSGATITISPPPGATPRSGMRVRSSARYGRAGVNAYHSTAEVANGAITTSPQVVSGTTIVNGNFPDAPFPWSADDTIHFAVRYETT